jgi:drug/metabolite transporter (DMT)-like permease
MVTRPLRDHPQFAAYAALVGVCFFWGTTYLGIRIGIESLAPATLVCVRYLISGAITLACGKIAGARLPRGRDLWITAGFGVITIGVGNGGVTYAELGVPSGLAALFIAAEPFWLAGVDAVVPGGDRLDGPTIRAMLIGTAGVVLLAWPSAQSAIRQPAKVETWAGLVLLQVAAAGWAVGSILQRRQNVRAHPFMTGGVQQLATGIAYLIPAMLAPGVSHWNTRSASAVLYLAIFGGIVGYGCFSLALHRLPVVIVSIYTYVNPIVAVVLGWLFYREPFGALEAAAMAIIFLGVALVTHASVAAQKLRAHRAAHRRQQAEEQERQR